MSVTAVCALPFVKTGSTGDFYSWRWGEHSQSWLCFFHKRETPWSCYHQIFVSAADKPHHDARLMQHGLIPLPPEYLKPATGK